jgi:hypothetical protein
MEMSQGNSLYCCLKQTKMSFFLSQNERTGGRAEQVLSGGLVLVGRGRMGQKGVGKVNMVQILCTHVCKWKNETC